MGVDTRQRITKKAAVLDKCVSTSPPASFLLCGAHVHLQCRDLLDGLRARGFQMNEGLEGTGVGLLLWINPDGLYFSMPLSCSLSPLPNT